jgi:hypothetical protein
VTHWRLGAAILTLLAVSPLPAAAKSSIDPRPGEEHVVLSLGAFLQEFETDLRVDNDGGAVGDDVDLESDLDLESEKSIAWGDLTWRFAPRHRIGLTAFRFTRLGSASAEDDLTIGDEIYPAGASVETEFKFQVMALLYSYSFIKREKHEFSGTFGLHWFDIDLGFEGSASLGSEDASADAGADAVAPLPLLGVRYDYHITPRWTLGFLGEVLAIEFESDATNFSGKVWNVRASAEYRFLRCFGAGIAFNEFGIDVDVDDSGWAGAFNYSYFGPQVYVLARF